MTVSPRTRRLTGRTSIKRFLLLLCAVISFSVFLLGRSMNSKPSEDLGLHDSPQQSEKTAAEIGAVRDIVKLVMNIGRSFVQQTFRRPHKDFIAERWYFSPSKKNVTFYSSALPDLHELWPRADLIQMDRIENQLLFKPSWITPVGQGNSTNGLKLIFVPDNVDSWYSEEGRGTFLKDKCPVNTCFLTNDKTLAKKADAIMFRGSSYGYRRSDYPESQIWILYLLESPLNTPNFSSSTFNLDSINWTATYRSDSDIVTPYGRYGSYDPTGMLEVGSRSPAVDYASRKKGKGKVVWFVSNCQAHNNRKDYANELAKHIPVDIYGSCGDKKCGKDRKDCMEMLQTEYKFYLAFENSNCRWYITEKMWDVSFKQDLIPIVMGAPLEDYKAVAPPKSFIHVDEFAGPEQLAHYLRELDLNDVLYNEYFQWRTTGEIVNTYTLCRVCAMLHSNYSKKHYDDIERWWRAPGTCQTKR
ncbi:hypothetical protein RvY_09504 [Ramazzottius varieornatus]|uniref:Fucosyltransferase n=1 Tax=Ramazzottius varieornatus TaxID=947166 RepID=A0A1D1V9J9_RAMVA|nr:hypothetical protein RvY_09504 [Ramazzottius varieornatus]